MIGRWTAWAMAASLAGSAAAQQVSAVSVGNAPQGADATPQDEGGKVVDRGGLASRGGRALQGRRNFGGAIGSSIYTPIGTSMFTPVQTPPETGAPQS